MRQADLLARQARSELQRKASPAYARRMQRFFKAPVPAYGWRTAAVRKLASRLRREISQTGGQELLLTVAEKLFAGPTLEEKALGVTLLERSVRKFDDTEFRHLERWLRWVNTWAACDALAGWLLGPLIATDSRRLPQVFRWAKSKNPWYRRAAAVSLIPAARKGNYGKEVLRLADRLLLDNDYMVQKGVGWLLKENTKLRHSQVVRFLLRVKKRAPRLTLRIACEKLPRATRQRILG